MSKGRNSKSNAKKAPAKTKKEKRAAKMEKKNNELTKIKVIPL